MFDGTEIYSVPLEIQVGAPHLLAGDQSRSGSETEDIEVEFIPVAIAAIVVAAAALPDKVGGPLAGADGFAGCIGVVGADGKDPGPVAVFKRRGDQPQVQAGDKIGTRAGGDIGVIHEAGGQGEAPVTFLLKIASLKARARPKMSKPLCL